MCSTVPHTKPCPLLASQLLQTHKSRRKPITVALLSGHIIKLPSKYYVYIHGLRLSASVKDACSHSEQWLMQRLRTHEAARQGI